MRRRGERGVWKIFLVTAAAVPLPLQALLRVLVNTVCIYSSGFSAQAH